MLLPEIERQQRQGKDVVVRADAAFAKPEIYETLEGRDVKYAIRIPSNDILEREVAEVLTRPAVVRFYIKRGTAGQWIRERPRLAAEALRTSR